MVRNQSSANGMVIFHSNEKLNVVAEVNHTRELPQNSKMVATHRGSYQGC
ncbi:hypothetical protein HanPI659440_Chr03g0123801 [Helianthus annuus]|nr:hypothetical protein HanPI659440_Chr03g0123801 [Helianthus annuus]